MVKKQAEKRCKVITIVVYDGVVDSVKGLPKCWRYKIKEAGSRYL